MRAAVKRHASENGEAATFSFSRELIAAVIILAGSGSIAGGYVTFGGIGEKQVERAVSGVAEEQRAFIIDVIATEASTFTQAEVDAEIEKRDAERKAQLRIEVIEEEVGELKADVSEIGVVQQVMAADMKKLVRAIPDP